MVEVVRIGNRRFTIRPSENGKVWVDLVQGMSHGEVTKGIGHEIEPTIDALWKTVAELLVDDCSTDLCRLATLMRKVVAPEGNHKEE